MKDLTLVKRAPFSSMTVDYYGDGRGNFYMTRDQIGRALGYSNPRAAIKDIHKRHEKRLDRACPGGRKLRSPPEAFRTQSYTLQRGYTKSAAIPICRLPTISMTAVYEVLEGLRLGYLSLKVEKASPLWQATRAGSKEARKAEGDT